MAGAPHGVDCRRNCVRGGPGWGRGRSETRLRHTVSSVSQAGEQRGQRVPVLPNASAWFRSWADPATTSAEQVTLRLIGSPEST